MLNKIVISGPESSGKTTLFNELCGSYSLVGVSEYARDYIANLERNYTYNDILLIAQAQLNNEQVSLKSNQPFVLTDSDLLTLEIWCEFKYNKCHSFIENNLRENLPNLYLLCYPEIPWEFDLQRENPNDRMELFEIYENKIKSLGVDYNILRGDRMTRLKTSKRIINSIENS
jgi:nicotinamide riboside kinase